MDAKRNDLLSIKDLKVEYVTDQEVVSAVNGVSFTLQKGETLGLVGETGAGKTTIARAIMRILPDPPCKIKNGEILMDGVDLLKLGNKEMRSYRGKRISMIFQDPMTALNPIMRIGDQIAETIINNLGVTKQEAVKKAKEMLELVGIPAARYMEYPHQFSGGMKQRVVIAMALACNPDLLIADEPTTALDVTIQAQILSLMNKMHEEYGTTVIMITHDLGVVAETCDNVAVVYAGQIIEYGTVRQVFLNHLHPYTEGLFNAIPTADSGEELQSIEGLPPDPTNLPKGCYFSPRCPYATDACKKDQIPMKTAEDGHLYRCIK